MRGEVREYKTGLDRYGHEIADVSLSDGTNVNCVLYRAVRHRPGRYYPIIEIPGPYAVLIPKGTSFQDDAPLLRSQERELDFGQVERLVSC